MNVLSQFAAEYLVDVAAAVTAAAWIARRRGGGGGGPGQDTFVIPTPGGGPRTEAGTPHAGTTGR